MLSRTLILAYAALAYALALATIAWLLGFIAGIGVPKGINDGAPGPVSTAVAVDLGLVWLFGLHHSATARRWVKARWRRRLPPAMERPTYLYMTAAMTALLIWQWRPIPVTLWQVEGPAALLLTGLFLGVCAAMVAATFQIGHFGFFGLSEAWARFRHRRPSQPGFSARWLYGLVRHPISLGWLLLPWLTPHMTLGQLVFALGVAAYVLAAAPFEEADLVAQLGDTYRAYRRRVPAFVPRLGRREAPAPTIHRHQQERTTS